MGKARKNSANAPVRRTGSSMIRLFLIHRTIFRSAISLYRSIIVRFFALPAAASPAFMYTPLTALYNYYSLSYSF